MTAGFEMLSYLSAMALPSANDFYLLAIMSAAMVLAGLALFSFAHRSHTLAMRSKSQYIALV